MLDAALGGTDAAAGSPDLTTGGIPPDMTTPLDIAVANQDLQGNDLHLSDAASEADLSAHPDLAALADLTMQQDLTVLPPDLISTDLARCGAPVIEQHPDEGHLHVPACSVVNYASNPPSSGNHYPVWAAFQSFNAPVSRGYYVRDLEHGAVVMTYNCPGGCAAEVAAAQAFIDSLPADGLCGNGGPPHNRIVLTPDPLLDVRWAASAWFWTIKAQCFDPVAFRQFVTDHYGKAPENECANGTITPTC